MVSFSCVNFLKFELKNFLFIKNSIRLVFYRDVLQKKVVFCMNELKLRQKFQIKSNQIKSKIVVDDMATLPGKIYLI